MGLVEVQKFPNRTDLRREHHGVYWGTSASKSSAAFHYRDPSLMLRNLRQLLFLSILTDEDSLFQEKSIMVSAVSSCSTVIFRGVPKSDGEAHEVTSGAFRLYRK